MNVTIFKDGKFKEVNAESVKDTHWHFEDFSSFQWTTRKVDSEYILSNAYSFPSLAEARLWLQHLVSSEILNTKKQIAEKRFELQIKADSLYKLEKLLNQFSVK